MKHCEDEAEVRKFIKFLETEPGQLRFKTHLRERKTDSNPKIIRKGDLVKVTSWYGRDKYGYYAGYEERFKPYVGKVGKVLSVEGTWDYMRRQSGPDRYLVEFPDGERRTFSGREVTFWASGE